MRLLLRSEEHTSELQSPCNLVCRLLLEKKKKKQNMNKHTAVNQHAIRTAPSLACPAALVLAHGACRGCRFSAPRMCLFFFFFLKAGAPPKSPPFPPPAPFPI